MVICYILGCKSRSERKCENITFHTFPKDSTIRQIWIRATRRDNWIPSKYARICSKHFERNCFRKTSRNVYLKAYSVPTLHITAKKSHDVIEIPTTSSAAMEIDRNPVDTVTPRKKKLIRKLECQTVLAESLKNKLAILR
ncbi:THAP domain-containing protein 2-like [Achroia grisella]|uniref:THAP domain-containing protein 2-like n=1 Tax=Achroia grisella TaxID=688607 RepID=UPI0027D23C92|nr:THAP domain-containing protein 2-like [Achroia grisella]